MKSYTTYLQEARKNPSQNPKRSIASLIDQYLLTAKNLPGSNDKNAFISFTNVDKLGINPQSGYNTPLGIYSFPAQYAYHVGNNTMEDLPFAGDSEYGTLFSLKGNIIYLNDLSLSDMKTYVQKIIKVALKHNNVRKGSIEEENIVEGMEFLEDESRYNAKISSPGGRFWYITREATAYFIGDRNIIYGNKTTKVDKNNYTVTTNRYSTLWNKLFRSIGIDAAIDYGEGIIHSSEKTQCVVFNPRAIKNKVRAENKYSAVDMHLSTKVGNAKKEINKSIQVLNKLSNDPIKYLSYLHNITRRINDKTYSLQKSYSYVKQIVYGLLGYNEFINIVYSINPEAGMDIMHQEPEYDVAVAVSEALHSIKIPDVVNAFFITHLLDNYEKLKSVESFQSIFNELTYASGASTKLIKQLKERYSDKLENY